MLRVRAAAHFAALPLGAGATFIASARGGVASALACVAFLCAGACFETVSRRGVAADRPWWLVEEGRVRASVLSRAPETAPEGYYLALEVERLRHAGREARASGAVELFAPVRDARALVHYETL